VPGLEAPEVAKLYRQYGFVLGRRARLFLRDDALAQDAVQELLVTLLRRGEGVMSAESPYRFICRALDRVCIDLLRKNQRTRSSVSLDHADGVTAAPGIDVDVRRAVLQSLERLGEREQAVAIAVFVDGLSQGEAAEELGVSRVTINKDVQKIRAQLTIDFPRSEGGKELSP
jgi:RNA polymerase sigma factor (sigma-70 family)